MASLLPFTRLQAVFIYITLLDCFANERLCKSDYDIKDYMYKQTCKENERLKAEIKELKGEM